ncbi:cocaine- and amphetamine-regulated transcript protein isoform X1 [Melospiza melodia melodia]|uniref:cocaine- and amphetamine-regulated transcript protein isoform X1 n=1 Tax=Melospiza melodia melodia TaxID=1914991 RepID=UPI002FD5CB8D
MNRGPLLAGLWGEERLLRRVITQAGKVLGTWELQFGLQSKLVTVCSTNIKIEALQEVLEKLKSKRGPHYEKKFGQVPMCDAGEQCAVRKGARIGKLCDCPRGTSCNSFLLKCL